MALHVDHPIAYDDAFIASRIVERERKVKRSLLAFAIAIFIAIPLWLAFLLYL
jgi:hypothetical protein